MSQIMNFLFLFNKLEQESRTLEMNNVEDGTWHGRGDTICIAGTHGEGGKFVELHPPHIVSV